MDVDPRVAARGAAHAEGVRRGVYNTVSGKRVRPSTNANRAAMGAAARGAYNEIMAFLNEGSCSIGQLDKEFLALALSQSLTDDELTTLSPQAGGRRLLKGVQRGGALLDSVKRFLNALCGTVGRTVGEVRDSAAARLDAISASMNALRQRDITSGILTALPAAAAGSVILSGTNSGVVSLALLALKGINSAIPNPAALALNTYSGLAAWLPLVSAAAPVAGKLLTIALCYKAVTVTREYVRSGALAAHRNARGFDYEGALRELMNLLYGSIVAGAGAAGAGAGAGAGAVARGVRAAARASGLTIGTAIDQAVRILMTDADVAPVRAVIDAAGGGAAGGGAAGGGAAGGGAAGGGAAAAGGAAVEVAAAAEVAADELDELPANPARAPRANQLSNVESINSNATVPNNNMAGGKRSKKTGRKGKGRKSRKSSKKTRKNRK